MAPDGQISPLCSLVAVEGTPLAPGAFWIYGVGFMVNWSVPSPLIQGHFAYGFWIYAANPPIPRGRSGAGMSARAASAHAPWPSGGG